MGGIFDSQGYTNIPTTESGISYQCSEINAESNVSFGISTRISEFPGYHIAPANRESEKNTGTVQEDSESTITFDQDTKQINW